MTTDPAPTMPAAETTSEPPPVVLPPQRDGVQLDQILEPYETDYVAISDFTRYEFSCSLLTDERSPNGRDHLGREVEYGYWVIVPVDGSHVVGRGSVLHCYAKTDPPADVGSRVLIVLDDNGSNTWWIVGTAGIGYVPSAPPGLLCREYIATEEFEWAIAEMLQGDRGSPPWTDDVLAYQWALAYWFLEGEPERMDVDHNGIPCELLFDPNVVAEVWATSTSGSPPPPATDPFLIPPGVIEDGYHVGYLVSDNGTSFSFDRADIQSDGTWKNENPKVRTLPVSTSANHLDGAPPGTPIALYVANQHVEWVDNCAFRDSVSLCQNNQ